jgi:hypothetical protein
MNRTLGRPPARLIQLQGSRSPPEQGTDFTPVRLPAAKPPPHALQPSPPKRAKGFEPSTFSLGITIPKVCPIEKPPCNALIDGEATSSCAVRANQTIESVYKLCTATARIRGATAPPFAPEVGSVDGVPRKGDHEKPRQRLSRRERGSSFLPCREGARREVVT